MLGCVDGGTELREEVNTPLNSVRGGCRPRLRGALSSGGVGLGTPGLTEDPLVTSTPRLRLFLRRFYITLVQTLLVSIYTYAQSSSLITMFSPTV
jgi:hypothetical protein